MRIVSLVPSSTETLLALGADVVACTRFCEQPELTQVGGTKNPDIGEIVRLAPDLVVLDRQENRLEDAEALGAAGVPVFVTDVCTVDDALEAVAALAHLIGAPVPDLGVAVGGRVRVLNAFVPIWRRPWMSISGATYGASVLARIGCSLVTADAADPYPVVELDEIAAADPDVVLVPSEPYDFTAAHLDDLRAAVPGALVERVDGRDLFWWGIRTPAALGALAAVVERVEALRRPPS